MSIDFQLPVPLLDQLHDITTDGFPAENADMDCVPTSIAAGLMGLLPGRTFDGDGVLDAVPAYGEGYTGGTAAINYVAFCGSLGVSLSPVDASNSDTLVADVHTLLHQGKPVLVTIPGQWNNSAFSGANPGPVSHVCCCAGDGPGEVRMMNPWGGFWHDVTDAWLARQLCYGQIWPMEKIAMLPQGWKDDGLTITASNGVQFGSGFAALFRKQPFWYAENVPVGPEHEADPVSIAQPEIGNGTRLDFHYGESFIWSRTENVEKFAPVNAEIALMKAQPAPAPAPAPANDPKAAAVKQLLARDLPILQDWIASS